MARFGMLKPVRLELPELGLPLYPGDWKPINTLTIAYGHGIAVTPLHLIAGVAGLIDGGIYRPVTIMKRDATVPFGGRRVITEKTSGEIRQLMRLVVESGTGKSANVPGYLVGGKTGTAEKQQGAPLHRQRAPRLLHRGLPDERAALRHPDHGRRAQAERELAWLRDGRLGGGAGGRPRDPAHGAVARHRTDPGRGAGGGERAARAGERDDGIGACGSGTSSKERTSTCTDRRRQARSTSAV